MYRNGDNGGKPLLLARQLINFFDMLVELSGHEVAYAYGYLANAYGISTNEPVSRPLDPDQKVPLARALEEVEKACRPERLDLPATLAHVPRVRRALEEAATYYDVQNPIGELRSRMHDELKARLFLLVPPQEASYYNQREPFGPEVAKRFPHATTDIESASDGIALGMHTASVFHLMRVMERGVQKFGKALKVALARGKKLAEHPRRINKAIKALPENTPRLKARKAEVATVSAYLYSVKLAWRNPVMHPKATYSPEEAVDVYGHVKSFMKKLASIL